MSKLFDELSSLKQQYDDKLANEGEAAVKELFKEFFDANPNVEDVHWTQYTPYFNDGDTCTFSVHEMYVTLGEEEGPEDGEESDEDEDDDDDYEEDDELSSWSLSRSEDPELKKLGEALDVLSDIPEDVLEHVFGDHVRIIATRAGFDVDEYSHD